jgi:hypothetical protein
MDVKLVAAVKSPLRSSYNPDLNFPFDFAVLSASLVNRPYTASEKTVRCSTINFITALRCYALNQLNARIVENTAWYQAKLRQTWRER